ncbi:MAG: divalent-cation tolerance protein CutA [Candidatus Omnitrophica bacterium]|nr:divalent-cation tolerance protein CutA [Candidatus Omnitrophota bacterium]
MKTKYVIVFFTCISFKEAEKIVMRLLDDRLIACANINTGIRSYFWWKGKIDKANEVQVTVKSRRSKFAMIKNRIKAMHSYEVPEIIAVDISLGERYYLKWIDESILL